MIVAESVALSYSIIVTDVTPAVANNIALAVTPLLLLGLILVVASRGRIYFLLSDHIGNRYPLRSLFMDLSLAVSMALLMANDLESATHLYPLFFWLAALHL